MDFIDFLSQIPYMNGSVVVNKDVINMAMFNTMGVYTMYRNRKFYFDAVDVLNDFTKVVNGDISNDVQSITITGGTATAVGDTWIVKSLGYAKKLSLLVFIKNSASSDGVLYIDFGNGDSSLSSGDGVSMYRVYLDISKVAEDFGIVKNIDGNEVVLSYEGVDLVADEWYKVMIDVDLVTGNMRIVRNSSIISVNDDDVDNLEWVRFLYSDSSTTAALSGSISCPMMISWE